MLLDPGRKVNDLFQVEGIPKSFLYDRSGKFVAEAIDMRTRNQFLRCSTKPDWINVGQAVSPIPLTFGSANILKDLCCCQCDRMFRGYPVDWRASVGRISGVAHRGSRALLDSMICEA